MLWTIVGTVIALLAVIAVGARPLASYVRRREAQRAIEQFARERPSLEQVFFDLASKSGKPRDVTWHRCDWQPEVAFARERETGLLTAFVSVNVSFAAIAGGDMEDVEHVGLLRDGCALFHWQNGQWGTGGRVVFNMNPQEALSRFASQYVALQPAA